MKSAFQTLQDLFNGKVKQNELMSLHTTYKIGGPAQYYVDVDTIEDLVKAVQEAYKLGIPVFVLGGGANIIVSDKGIPGLTVKNNCRKFDVMRMSGRIQNRQINVSKAAIFAESGVIMNQLVRFAIDQGLAGLEYQLGLPGTVGGAVFMNSNFPKEDAYVGKYVYSAKIITKDGEIKEVDNAYFRFAYDYSILQQTGEIVLSVIFKLLPEQKEVLWERATSALNHRRDSQPSGASAGCTFRNISVVEAVNVPVPNNITSAGYLIDKAGLKGKRVGDAMISEKHANFILNLGNAKADDVVQLLQIVKEEVYKKFKVHLKLEVREVGFN